MILFFNRNISTDILDSLDIAQVLYLRFHFKNIDLPTHRHQELARFRKVFQDLVRDGFLHDVDYLDKSDGVYAWENKIFDRLFDLEMISFWKIKQQGFDKMIEYYKRFSVNNVRYIMNNVPEHRIKIFEMFHGNNENDYYCEYIYMIERIIDLIEPNELNISMPRTDTIFDLYIRRGADIDLKDRYGNTVLHKLISCTEKNIKKIRSIIGAKCLIDAEDEYGYTPLMILCFMRDSYREDCEAALLLLDGKAQVNKEIIEGRSVLSFAVRNNKIDLADLLIKKKAEINKYDVGQFQTILSQAVLSHNNMMVRLLLDNMADPNYCGNKKDFSPLYVSIRTDFEISWLDNADITKMLIDAKADLEAVKNIKPDIYQIVMKSNKTKLIKLFKKYKMIF